MSAEGGTQRRDPWHFQRWAREVRTGHPTRKLILQFLAESADRVKGVCYPSQETLARWAEVGERTLRDHLRALEDAGVIERRVRGGRGDGRLPDWILLLAPGVTEWPDGVPVKVPKPAEGGQPEDIAGRATGNSEGGATGNLRGGQPAAHARATKEQPIEPSLTLVENSDASSTTSVVELRKLDGEREGAKKSTDTLIAELFDYWRQRCEHPKAHLTAERRAKLRARLRDKYSPAEIRRAIDGAALRPPRSDEGVVYDDLESICRNGAQLERYINRSAVRSSNGNGASDADDNIDFVRRQQAKAKARMG